MNANGGTCIMDCPQLRARCIKRIYMSRCAACTEYCVGARACTPSHHSIIPSRSGFRLRTCNLIDNFGATGVYAGVFCAACLCLCTRQREVGRHG